MQYIDLGTIRMGPRSLVFGALLLMGCAGIFSDESPKPKRTDASARSGADAGEGESAGSSGAGGGAGSFVGSAGSAGSGAGSPMPGDTTVLDVDLTKGSAGSKATVTGGSFSSSGWRAINASDRIVFDAGEDLRSVTMTVVVQATKAPWADNYYRADWMGAFNDPGLDQTALGSSADTSSAWFVARTGNPTWGFSVMKAFHKRPVTSEGDPETVWSKITGFATDWNSTVDDITAEFVFAGASGGVDATLSFAYWVGDAPANITRYTCKGWTPGNVPDDPNANYCAQMEQVRYFFLGSAGYSQHAIKNVNFKRITVVKNAS